MSKQARNLRFRLHRGSGWPGLSPGELLLEQINDKQLRRSRKHGANIRKYHSLQFWELEGQRALCRDAITAALKSVGGISITLDGWCRAMKVRYLMSPLSCIGSMRTSGRFNYGADIDENIRFQAFPALYIAENRGTAHCEMVGYTPPDGVIRGDGLPPEALALMRETSIAWLSLTGSMHNVFDLTEPKNLKPFIEATKHFRITSDFRKFERSIGIKPPVQLARTQARLMQTFMDASWRVHPMHVDLPANGQVFGQLLSLAGFEGVLYRSVRTNGLALAIFPRCFAASPSIVRVVDPLPGARCMELSASTYTETEREFS